MKIEYYGHSDKGLVRSANEDYFLCEEIEGDSFFFSVADGMGGHKAGDVASNMGTHLFLESFKKKRDDGKEVLEAMVSSMYEANSSILNRAATETGMENMGTTLSTCLITGNKCTVVHVGDSKIFHFRSGEIRKLTIDHTFIEKMKHDGKISEAEAEIHPQRNILYMSLGSHETFFPQVVPEVEVEAGDIFLLCSDGLTDMVNIGNIMSCIFELSPKDAATSLVKAANGAGGHDNITVVVVKIVEM